MTRNTYCPHCNVINYCRDTPWCPRRLQQMQCDDHEMYAAGVEKENEELRACIAEAVAAEREACCAVNAKLLKACEALVVRIDEWMALDMPCPLCDGYVPHFDDCPYTFAAAATILARAGEKVEVVR